MDDCIQNDGVRRWEQFVVFRCRCSVLMLNDCLTDDGVRYDGNSLGSELCRSCLVLVMDECPCVVFVFIFL